jgi:hypothetical protein
MCCPHSGPSLTCWHSFLPGCYHFCSGAWHHLSSHMPLTLSCMLQVLTLLLPRYLHVAHAAPQDHLFRKLSVALLSSRVLSSAVARGDLKTKVQCMFFPPPNSFDITDTSAQGPGTTLPLTHIWHRPCHLRFDRCVSQLDDRCQCLATCVPLALPLKVFHPGKLSVALLPSRGFPWPSCMGIRKQKVQYMFLLLIPLISLTLLLRGPVPSHLLCTFGITHATSMITAAALLLMHYPYCCLRLHCPLLENAHLL